MKKNISCIVLIVVLITSSALADVFSSDWLNASIEELKAAQTEIEARIKELEIAEKEAAKKAADEARSSAGGSILESFKNNGIEPVKVDAEFLCDNFGDYIGTWVYSVFKMNYDSRGKTIDLVAANKNPQVFYDFEATFEDKDETQGLKKGTLVAILGKAYKERSSSFGQHELRDCHIISVGDQTAELQSELKQLVDIANAQKAEAKKEEQSIAIATYKSECRVLPYNDIERNPKNYKGQKAKVTGKVIQAQEGWFDSVTLRVQDKNNDIWYVTYTMGENESRILEKDTVTIYGICDGVETYTTILGGSVTIPSIEAKYIDVNY